MHECSLKGQEAAGLSDFVIWETKNKDAAVVSSDYEESKREINKNKKRKLMEVLAFSACLNQQPTLAGVDGNLEVNHIKYKNLKFNQKQN